MLVRWNTNFRVFSPASQIYRKAHFCGLWKCRHLIPARSIIDQAEPISPPRRAARTKQAVCGYIENAERARNGGKSGKWLQSIIFHCNLVELKATLYSIQPSACARQSRAGWMNAEVCICVRDPKDSAEHTCTGTNTALVPSTHPNTHTRRPPGSMSRDEPFWTTSKNRLKYLGLHALDDVIPLWIIGLHHWFGPIVIVIMNWWRVFTITNH
jgi:hypothetical protein